MVFGYNIEAGKTGTVTITDLTGKTISRYTITGNNSLNINEPLENGIYFYILTIDGEVMQQDKIVVIK